MSLAFQIRDLDGSGALAEDDLVMVQHASHTFGGRRIETPRGGSPPPTHPWRSGKSVIDVLSWQVFDVYGFFCRKSRKNRPKTLQNRGPGPPKSSLEPSKTPFLQDIYLKKVKKELHHNFLRPKWPTWLHLGGPRPSKIEAETRKKRC